MFRWFVSNIFMELYIEKIIRHIEAHKINNKYLSFYDTSIEFILIPIIGLYLKDIIEETIIYII